MTGFAENAGLLAAGIGVAFELATHIFVHYTVPGASLAAGLAQTVAPALDAVGLTTVFGEAAIAEGAAAAAESVLPSLDSLS